MFEVIVTCSKNLQKHFAVFYMYTLGCFFLSHNQPYGVFINYVIN